MNTRARYPGRAVVERVLSAARGAGVEVGGLEIDADGTIRIIGGPSAKAAPKDLFAEWQTQAKE